MTLPEQIALAAIFQIQPVFVFCTLISENVLKWFLLTIWKRYTLIRSLNFFSGNHPVLGLLLRREGQQMSVMFMTGINCSEFYNKFTDIYLFSQRKFLLRMFLRQPLRKPYFRKKQPSSCVNMNLVFLLAVCTNSLLGNRFIRMGKLKLNPLLSQCRKMVRLTLKILPHLLQDF